jgi:Uncharacterised protein family (UPF0203)
MGSSQSSEQGPPALKNDTGGLQERKRLPPQNLTGPQLVEWKCRKKKRNWSECVGSFYGRFSAGKVLEDEAPNCDEMFETYRQCYLRGMLREREKKGLEPPKEGTLLAEFAEEEGIELQQGQRR